MKNSIESAAYFNLLSIHTALSLTYWT